MLNSLFDTSYLEHTDRYFIETKKKSYAYMNPKPNQTIIEMGCGIGLDAIRLAEYGCQVLGIDHDPEFIDFAKKSKHSNLNFIQADCINTGLSNQSVDAIRYERVLQHIENKEAALSEAYRILKPEGSVCIVDTDFLSFNLFLDKIEFEQKLMRYLYTQRAPFSGVLRELPLLLAKEGFELSLMQVIPYFIQGKKEICSIIDFEKAIKSGIEDKIFSNRDLEYWFGLDEKDIYFSLHSLIYLAVKS